MEERFYYEVVNENEEQICFSNAFTEVDECELAGQQCVADARAEGVGGTIRINIYIQGVEDDMEMINSIDIFDDGLTNSAI